MKKLLYLDLETTGLDHKSNSIHEIGAIVEIDGFVAGEFEIKLRPNPLKDIEQVALDVSGKKLTDLTKYQSFTSGFDNLIELLGGFDTVLSKFTIVAYNGGALDIPFFKEFFIQNDSEKLFFSMFYNQFIDPMNNLHEATLIEGSRSNISSLSLKGAAKFLGVPFDESKLHGAMYDTKVLREVKLAYDERYKNS